MRVAASSNESIGGRTDGRGTGAAAASGASPSQRTRQHYELEANRAFIDGRWKIASLQPRGGKNPRDAIASAMVETQGEA